MSNLWNFKMAEQKSIRTFTHIWSSSMCNMQVKNETWALWSWYRNQDSYKEVGDQIYIVRQPDICPIHQRVNIDCIASI